MSTSSRSPRCSTTPRSSSTAESTTCSPSSTTSPRSASEAAPTPSRRARRSCSPARPLVRQVRPARRAAPDPEASASAAASPAWPPRPSPGSALTGAAAFANELPVPMQRVVAHFSESYLPFTFPRPVGDPPADGGTVTPGSPAQGGDAPATTGYGESGGFASTSPEGPTRGLVGITGKLDGRTNLDRSGDAAPAVTPGSRPRRHVLGLGGAEQPSTGTSVPAGGSSPDAAGTTAAAGADPGTRRLLPGPVRIRLRDRCHQHTPGNAYAGAGNAGKGGTQGNPAAPPPARAGRARTRSPARCRRPPGRVPAGHDGRATARTPPPARRRARWWARTTAAGRPRARAGAGRAARRPARTRRPTSARPRRRGSRR